MSKDKDRNRLKGVVTEARRDAIFVVKLDDHPDYRIFAHTSGKIRKSRIRILVGDRVLVEVSEYESSAENTGRGRIVLRLKENSNNPTDPPIES